MKLLILISSNLVIGLLDLFGVLTVGLLGVISVSNLSSSQLSPRIFSILESLAIDDMTFLRQFITLGIVALLFLLFRTVVSILISRKIMVFTSNKSSELSSHLISRFFALPFLEIQKMSTQSNVFALTTGVGIAFTGVIGNSAILISEVILLAVISVGLILVNPITFITVFISFFVVVTTLIMKVQHRARDLGEEVAFLNVKSGDKIGVLIENFRQIYIHDKQSQYIKEISSLRRSFGESSGTLAFIPYVGKYVIEIAVVLIAFAACLVQIVLFDLNTAIAGLAILLAAGSRMAPSFLRIQQCWISIVTSIGQSSLTLTMIRRLEKVDELPTEVKTPVFRYEDFVPRIQLRNVSFSYEDKSLPTLSSIDLSISAGEKVAIVGPSGAGKSTLVDIILGITSPDIGTVSVSGVSPQFAVKKWPGAISYVPQDIPLINGSLRENVTLDVRDNQIQDEKIWGALKQAKLDALVRSLPLGLDTIVGDYGLDFSGGERQRLGIARAIFSQPKLLILDEATSALDGVTEAGIIERITFMKSSTIIIIAHRLATVRDADIVIYLNKGRIESMGTFEEVRKSVIDFERQARYMGLK